MSLDTIITAGLSQYTRPATALVLMGGGARTAYQVGVLRALASILKLQPASPKVFPFQLLIGTSILYASGRPLPVHKIGEREVRGCSRWDREECFNGGVDRVG